MKKYKKIKVSIPPVLITLCRSLYHVEFIITGESTIPAGYFKGISVHFNIMDCCISTFKTIGRFFEIPLFNAHRPTPFLNL